MRPCLLPWPALRCRGSPLPWEFCPRPPWGTYPCAGFTGPQCVTRAEAGRPCAAPGQPPSTPAATLTACTIDKTPSLRVTTPHTLCSSRWMKSAALLARRRPSITGAVPCRWPAPASSSTSIFGCDQHAGSGQAPCVQGVPGQHERGAWRPDVQPQPLGGWEAVCNWPARAHAVVGAWAACLGFVRPLPPSASAVDQGDARRHGLRAAHAPWGRLMVSAVIVQAPYGPGRHGARRRCRRRRWVRTFNGGLTWKRNNPTSALTSLSPCHR